MEELNGSVGQMNEFAAMGSSQEAEGFLAMLMGAGIGVMVFLVAIMVVMMIARYKVLEKAGQPGWAIFVPIYNIIVLFKVAKVPGWWFIMFFIPIANIIFMIKFTHAISKNFGKDGGFTAGLIFLPLIFWPILGFGSAQYVGNESGASNGEVLDA